jgi:hypothetical protein
MGLVERRPAMRWITRSTVALRQYDLWLRREELHMYYISMERGRSLRRIGLCLNMIIHREEETKSVPKLLSTAKTASDQKWPDCQYICLLSQDGCTI